MKKFAKLSKSPLLFLAAFLFLFSLYITNSNVLMGKSSSAYADTTPGGKSLTFRTSVSANGEFNGRGLAVTMPSNIQAGDLLIAVAGTNGPRTTWITPTGWTLGANSNTLRTQGLNWWWKVADGTEARTKVTFKSNKYSAGGIVVNVYEGQVVDPIAGVSTMATSDNDGVGNVTSAGVSGVIPGSSVNAVPLLFVSWQQTPATISWPSGFGFESTASDGFATVDIAENLNSLLGDAFPGYTLSFNPAQAIVQTLQVLIRVQ